MRLAADAAHQFGGIELDRSKPLQFRLDGHPINGFAGDTVLSAVLAAGIDTYGRQGASPIGLTEAFNPLVLLKGKPLPMDRLPAGDGLDLTSVGPKLRLPLRQPGSLRHRLEEVMPAADQLRGDREALPPTDVLVVGGGVAGLSAASAAAAAGHTVTLVERRPWWGGDARYFGAVGDDESPDALIARLVGELTAAPNVTLLLRAEVMALNGHNATIHQVVVGDGPPRGRLLGLAAARMVLATGSLQRLPVFPGNRLPGVSTAIGAYHLAKRYGVVHGASAVIATQSNYGYRLALRLYDAGVAIRRVIDIRINPQSRFIDFAKASGLTIASGQFPLLAQPGNFAFANIGSVAAAATIEATQLIVGGPWQPDLALWMQAGGAVQWNKDRSVLEAGRPLEHIELVGSAAGYRSMLACAQSGREAVAALFGQGAAPVEDVELGTFLETPDASFPVAPPVAGAPSFLSSGQSLAHQAADARLSNLSLGDVAASVELGVIAPADAGAVAEERGAPGPDLVASTWTPPLSPAVAPAYLAHRFGEAPERLHLVVDDKRGFEVGALIYAAGVAPEPVAAIGAIVETASPGGIALVSRTAASEGRFVIETAAGPVPARVRAPQA